MAWHITWIIICMAIVVTDTRVVFLSARNYVKTFTNGPGGECEFSTRRHEQITCQSVWTGNGSVSSDRKTLAHRRRCTYFKKTSIYLCYGTNSGRNGSVTCTKSVSNYMMRPACTDTWLNWETCDKPCGGGRTARVRFSMSGNKYEQMTEIRACNTHHCSHWGPWRPKLGNNGTSSCNMTTCSMLWERDCIYDNRAAPVKFCSDVQSSNNSRDQIFLSQRETNCSVHECAEPTTSQNTVNSTRSTELLDGSLKTTKARAYRNATMIATRLLNTTSTSFPQRSSNTSVGAYRNATMIAIRLLNTTSTSFPQRSSNTSVGAYRNATMIATRLLNTTWTSFPERSSNTSVAFAVQIVAVDGAQEEKSIWVGFGIGFLVASSVLIVAFLVRKLLLRRGTWRKRQHKENWESARTEDAKEYARSSFLIERIQPSTQVESVYSTVQQQQTELALIRDVHSQNDARNDTIADTTQCPSDPLYSHIPAYEPDTNECYPTSEFESTNEDSDEGEISSCGRRSDVDKDTDMSRACFDVAKEACKSFDSDENRDVVHTLRKQSTRSKRSPMGRSDVSDVFLSDEEFEKNDNDTEHKFAFSRRYSKMLAKRAKRSLSRKPNHPVEAAGFQWIEQPPDSSSIGGPRKLSSHSSLGASSVTSFNVDTATSGYNSAIGDSTDEEHSVRHKRRLASSQSPQRRCSTRQKSLLEDRHSERTRSLAINSLFATERRNHFGGNRLQLHNSYNDQGISSSTGAARLTQTQQKSPIVRPFFTVRPSSYQRSVSLISRQGRIIPIDDIYSNPVDAEVQDANATQYWEYELPIDALRNKSVLSKSNSLSQY